MDQPGRSLCAALISILLTGSALAADYPAALRCAAHLMGQPTPPVGILLLEPTIPACNHPQGCIASQVSVKALWAVYGKQPMAWDIMVHEACHRVQAARTGWQINDTMHGPRAETECERIQARANTCRH